MLQLYIRDFNVRIAKHVVAHELVEGALGQRLQELEAEVNSLEIANLGEIARSRAIYDHWNVQEEVPQVVRAALFLYAYAMFERTLRLIEDAVQDHLGLTSAVRDLRGDGIERSRVYLKKIAKLGFPDQSREWVEIRRFRVIRNVLAHRRGMLDETKDSLVREFAKVHPEQLRIEEDEIRILQPFHPFVVETMNRFLELLRPSLP